MRSLAVLALCVAATGADHALSQPVAELLTALTETPGVPERGRAIVANRSVGLCLLCHSGPFPEVRLQGDLAPDLGGVGRRLSEGELRLRIADSARLYPATIMPSYYKTEGLTRVAPQFRDKPVLNAQQIEDVVAFLQTLK